MPKDRWVMLLSDPEQPVIISHAMRLSALAAAGLPAISRLQGLSLHRRRAASAGSRTN